MSLKSFHIFFIVVSVVLAFGFGAWGVYFHLVDSNLLYFVLGVSSFAVGIGLVVYGVKVARKLQRI